MGLLLCNSKPQCPCRYRRHEIIERYHPGENDPHLKVRKPPISVMMSISVMVLDDLNLIIRDIQEAHKRTVRCAPDHCANELKENLEAVENFKGSRLEKLVVLYCKQLGINYKNLSEEEFRWLIQVLKKSKKMGTLSIGKNGKKPLLHGLVPSMCSGFAKGSS